VFSSIDQHGRYAYGNQPRIGQWNLTRLAEALLPLLANDQDKAVADAEEALAAFGPRFGQKYEGGLRRKLGLSTNRDGDDALAGDLLGAMADNQADFTLTFRRLGEVSLQAPDYEPVRALFVDPTVFDRWASRWSRRLAEEPGDGATRQAAMRTVNPAFIPRNHRVEAVIEAAVERDDYEPFEELLRVLSRPYEDQPDQARYADGPETGGAPYRTFCGT
jgi:uncharacterized protein YdiU (UPF0061 family)